MSKPKVQNTRAETAEVVLGEEGEDARCRLKKEPVKTGVDVGVLDGEAEDVDLNLENLRSPGVGGEEPYWPLSASTYSISFS